MNKNINNFIGFNSSYKESSCVLFGVPFDGTASFKPGARFAPNAMREDSYAMESYSPYFDKDLEDLKLFDSGDIEIPFGNIQSMIDLVYGHTLKIVKDGKIPIVLGGEHLISYGAIKAVHEKYEDLHILHFDAHTDLREHYLGQPLSHATVFRRVHEFLGDGKIFQFCIRSGLKEEFEWAKKHTHLEKFDYSTLSDVVEKIKSKPIYITIDLDVFDPSVLSGTGTPEPGGIFFDDMMKILTQISKLDNVVGMDVVELAPQYDTSGVSTAVACKTLRELVVCTVT